MHKTLLLFFFGTASLAALSREDVRLVLHLSEIGSDNRGGIIELYNESPFPIDLCEAGVRLEVKKDTRSNEDPDIFGILTLADGVLQASSFSIPAYGYFLISASNTRYATIADFIITNTTDPRGYLDSNDTVYLGFDTISGPTDPDVIEYVGMGSNQKVPAFMGNTPAPQIPPGGSVERKAHFLATSASMAGGDDQTNGNAFRSGDNGEEFVARILPDFQNTASAPEPPGFLTGDFYIRRERNLPAIILDEQEVRTNVPLLAVSVVNLKGNPVTSLAVRGTFRGTTSAVVPHLRLICNTDTGILLEPPGVDSTTASWHLPAGVQLPAVASLQVVGDLVAPASEGATWYFSIATNEVCDSAGNNPAGLVVRNIGGVSVVRRLFISQVMPGRVTAADEYVELWNSGTRTVNTAGWRLRYRTSQGTITTRGSAFPSIDVPPGRFLLIGGNDYSGPGPDLSIDLDLSGVAAGFGLILNNAAGVEVDRLSVGDPVPGEGAPCPASTAPGSVYERKAASNSSGADMARGGKHRWFGNAVHSGVSRDDFVVHVIPDPHTLASGAEPVGDPVVTRVTGLTNQYGGFVTISGSNFTEYQEATTLIHLGSVPVTLTDVGAWWSNDSIRLKVPPWAGNDLDLSLERPDLANIVTCVHLASHFRLSPPVFTVTEPNRSALMRGQPLVLYGSNFGTYRAPLMTLQLAGVAFSDEQVLNWSSNRIAVLLPRGSNEILVGDLLLLSNAITSQNAGWSVAGFTNAPPALWPAQVTLTPALGGLDTRFTLELAWYDPEGDLCQTTYPRVNFTSPGRTPVFLGNPVMEQVRLGVFVLEFSGRDFALADLELLEPCLCAASVTGNTLLTSNFLPLPAVHLDLCPPPMPVRLRMIERTSNSCTIAWLPLTEVLTFTEADFLHYELSLLSEASRQGATPVISLQYITDSNQSSWVISELEPDLGYQLSFRACDTYGNQSGAATLRIPPLAVGSAISRIVIPGCLERGAVLLVQGLPEGAHLALYDETGRRLCERTATGVEGSVEISAGQLAEPGLRIWIVDDGAGNQRTGVVLILP